VAQFELTEEQASELSKVVWPITAFTITETEVDGQKIIGLVLELNDEHVIYGTTDVKCGKQIAERLLQATEGNTN
jgi:hypothetical protein